MKHKKFKMQTLNKAVAKFGATYVANAMGYKSPSTVKHWIKNKAVPELAIDRVCKFLEEHTS